MTKFSKQLLLKIIIITIFVIAIPLLGFYIYLNFFFSFADKNIDTLMSYEYLLNQYYQHKKIFSCVENIKPGYRIYLLSFEKKSFLNPAKIKLNDKYYEIDDKNTNQITEIAIKEKIKENDLFCLLEILRRIQPFFASSIDNKAITFSGYGSYFDSDYGLKYFFNEKEGIDKEERSTIDQRIIIFSQKKIENNWYTFYET